jgi:hypothetical protein
MQAIWPIAVSILPLIVGAGFLWLKTQFPTKSELAALEGELVKKLDGHLGRFERGSAKFAEHDRRLALVEEDCESAPSKNDLNQGITVLAGRMSGMESGLKGVERQLNTQHDYLRTLIDQGLHQGKSQ